LTGVMAIWDKNGEGKIGVAISKELLINILLR